MLKLIVSLTIAAMAGAGAAASPPPTGDAPSVAVARAFLFDLQAMDVPAALSHFAADGVQEMPFAPEGFPSRLEGIDALARQYGGLPQAYDSMRFDIASAHSLDDPQWAVLEYHGTIRQKNGRTYDNDYVGLFRVVEGRIALFREYFNPIVLQQSFGDDLGDTFTLPGPR